MKAPVPRLTVQDRLVEQCFDWEGLPVLSLRLSLPQIAGGGRGGRRMDRYYRHLERRLLDWAASRHARTCCLAQEALEACKPLPRFSIQTAYQVTFQDDARLSILWRLEAEGRTETFADLWALPDGTPLNGRALLPRKQARKARGKLLLLTEEGVCALEDGVPVPLVPQPT